MKTKEVTPRVVRVHRSVCIHAAVVSVVLFATATAVEAVTISITNGDFETPVLSADDTFTSTFPSGWSQVGTNGAGSVGVERLATSHFASGQPRSIDGNQVAYVNNGPFTWGQNTTVNLTANTLYTLSIYIGLRNDTSYTGYKFGLFAGGTTPIVQESDAVTPASGTWIQRTLTYTALAGDPLLGQPIWVEFGNTSSGGQTVFDKVTLDASSVPEPSCAVLFVLGAGVLVVMRRKKFRV
jgi:hypothetical protein